MGYTFMIFTILSGLFFQAGLFAVGVAAAVVASALAFTLCLHYINGDL